MPTEVYWADLETLKALLGAMHLGAKLQDDPRSATDSLRMSRRGGLTGTMSELLGGRVGVEFDEFKQAKLDGDILISVCSRAGE